MFTFLTNALLVALLTGNLGGMSWGAPTCDPARGVSVLEDLRHGEDGYEWYWEIDQPKHLTPVRVHGGIGP